MTANSRTFAFGTLEETGDTWLLIARDRIIPLDVTLSDLSLERKTVSVIGKVGIPPSAPGITKLIVEKLVTHDDIAKRAYEIYKDHGGSADENWFRAEGDLLHV
jgi:hypothetical protein